MLFAEALARLDGDRMAILDLESASGREFPDPDVCIVGAGAAGIVLATELVKQGRRVVILEGGGRTLEHSSQALYDGHVVGHPHAGITQGRYRTYGGSTIRWGGQIMEFDASDFEEQKWLPGSGWPISKKELAPYYARALEAEGLSGVETSDEEVWRQLLGAPPDLEPALSFRLSRWTPDPDFTRVHREILETSHRLVVYTHANSTQLTFDPAGRRVSGVTCFTLGGKAAEFHAGRFVLCLGGIETVRFLLQPDHRAPWTGHPLLGRHFHDRVGLHSATVEPINWRAFQEIFSNAWLHGWKFHVKFKLRRELRDSERLLDVISSMVFEDDSDQSLVRLKTTAKNVRYGRLNLVSGRDLGNVVARIPTLARHAWHIRRYGRAYHSRATRIKLGAQCEQEPLGDSQIRLADDRDASGMFRVALDWRISDLELRTLRRYTELVSAALRERGLARVVPDPDLHSDAIEQKCVDVGPQMGGARMADDPARGLVDHNLRLHGTDNAYVCSTAVFPTSGSASPTHTLIALAVRLADEISGARAASADSQTAERI